MEMGRSKVREELYWMCIVPERQQTKLHLVA